MGKVEFIKCMFVAKMQCTGRACLLQGGKGICYFIT